MPPPSPSRSPLPPDSPPEVSSRRPPSPVYEHGRPFEGISVVDLSSEEEDAFPNTSRDEECARKLFDDLNRGLLGPPTDNNIIILSDFDEVREEDVVDAEAGLSSVVNSPTPTISATDDTNAPDRVPDDSNDGGDEAVEP
jgi:hypothetical protein